MHQNPHLRAPPSTPPQHSHKKSHQGPQRAQISLKSRRKKQIPQIKIQLDDMLGQAFTQIKMQPKKNIRIGNNDIFVLDNQLLRQYVEAVYEEYGIEDPLADIDVSSNASQSKIRSNSNYGRGYQTPIKTQNLNKSVIKQREQAGNQNNSIANSDLKINKPSNIHTQSRLNKTAQRISKLKQNFQSQLKSNPTAVFENQTRTQKKRLDEISHDSSNSHSGHPRDNNTHSHHHNSMHLNPQNQKKTQIKIIRRSSQKAQQSRVKQISQSNILKKTKHKYCLMCEQQLESDLINSHEKECPELQQLLNTPNLRIQQIQQILSEKIRKLEREFQFYQNHVHEDTNLLREIYQKIKRGELGDDDEDGNQDGQGGDGGTDLTRAFSLLNTVKCMEGLDKLNWFRKMKAKAEIKKGNGTSY